MAYNSGIPATGHSGSQDYTGIQGNFQQLQTTFSIDHEPIDSGGGIDGFHKQVHFAVQGSQGTPVDPISVIYALNGSGLQFNGHPVPCFNNSVGTYPLLPDVTGSPSFGQFSWGPLRVSFGTVTIAAGQSSITRTLGFAYTNIYTAQATINKQAQFGGLGARSVYIGINGSQLVVICEPSAPGGVSIPVYYFIIGV